MIIVTGGAGFIGSALLSRLNAEGIDNILVVDHLGDSTKWKNLVGKSFVDYIRKDEFIAAIAENPDSFHPEAVVHLGACTSTTEQNAEYLIENNFHYTKALAEWALMKRVRFIYASSAATYGSGTDGFSDSEKNTLRLRPLNMYGYSKHLFDLWALRTGASQQFAGLKFFNVYGPNEYHKGEMASVVLKSYQQIKSTGKVSLFRSHKEGIQDGEQQRDFIYVKDCVDVIYWLLEARQVNGIFNLGTGVARSWNDLIRASYTAVGKAQNIEYIDIPESIRNNYQYFTEATTEKLRAAGYTRKFLSLEAGVTDYIKNYLEAEVPYL